MWVQLFVLGHVSATIKRYIYNENSPKYNRKLLQDYSVKTTGRVGHATILKISV